MTRTGMQSVFLGFIIIYRSERSCQRRLMEFKSVSPHARYRLGKLLGKACALVCLLPHIRTNIHTHTLYKSGFVGPAKPRVTWVHPQPMHGSQKNRKLCCLTRICLGYFCGTCGDIFFSIVSLIHFCEYFW